MKTQVIQLERHDDATSVIDKINWSKANRILLVWPRRGRVLSRMLDLLLIQRACHTGGAQLACVSDDDDVLDHAQELGIPVFRSARAAEKIPWRRVRRKRILEPHPIHAANYYITMRTGLRRTGSGWLEKKYVRWTVFTLGILAIMGLMVFVLPAATVKLALSVEEQSVDLKIWSSPDLQAVNLSGGIPASIRSTLVEATQTTETTGAMTIPDQTSSGVVEFTNLSDQTVHIPSGTMVQTDREPIIQFRTKQSAVLDAQPGAKVEVAVQAVQAGSQGNIHAGEIQAVIGSLGTEVSVINPDAITGGRDISASSASQMDLDQLREQIVRDLQDSALQQFQTTQDTEYRLLPQTLQMVKIQDERVEPAFGLPADQIQMTLRVEFQIWSYRESDLETLARAALNTNFGSRKNPLQGSFKMDDLQEPVYENDEVRWKIRASQYVQTDWDGKQVVQEIAGQTIATATKNLAELPGLVGPPHIDLSPSWWPVIPLLPARIEVEIR